MSPHSTGGQVGLASEKTAWCREVFGLTVQQRDYLGIWDVLKSLPTHTSPQALPLGIPQLLKYLAAQGLLTAFHPLPPQVPEMVKSFHCKATTYKLASKLVASK